MMEIKPINTSIIPKTFSFIAILRTIATVLITNTHYGSIYPISALAVGGLIGDVLFFAVSGFCLANIGNAGAFKWYGKRIIRIYPTVIISTILLIVFGIYDFTYKNIIHYFVYPTVFHFIESIMVLYALFYIVMKTDFLKKHIPSLMVCVALVWFILYMFLFDKSQRFDVAALHYTRFLFFEIMLFGAYVRNNITKFLNKNKILNWVWVAISVVAYFLSKLIIDKYNLMNFQFVIILLIFGVGASMLIAFCGIEESVSSNRIIMKFFNFFAALTLEIYTCQQILIVSFKNLIFPLNFIVTTLGIIILAWLINKLSYIIRKILLKAVKI